MSLLKKLEETCAKLDAQHQERIGTGKNRDAGHGGQAGKRAGGRRQRGAENFVRNPPQMTGFRIDLIIGPFTISACLNRLSQPSHGMARRTQRGKQVLVACQLRRQDS